MKIEYRRSAAFATAYALIAEGWNELVQEGLTPGFYAVCPVDWRSEVLHAAHDDGEIVGVICFIHDSEMNAIDVTLGYVELTSRRRGVFSALYAALLKLASERRVARVMFNLHRDNVAGRGFLERRGSRASLVTYESILET